MTKAKLLARLCQLLNEYNKLRASSLFEQLDVFQSHRCPNQAGYETEGPGKCDGL